MHAPRNIAAACALWTLSFAGLAAAADDDAAAKTYDRGIEHMEGGRFEQACPLIEESYKLDPRPGTLFALAECEAQRGRIATAITRYGEYIAMYSTLAPAKKGAHWLRERESRKKKAELEAQVPRLVLVLPKDAPAGTVVKRDGAVVEASALGSAVEVDPGDHTVSTQAPGGPVTEVVVKVELGQRKELALAVKPAGVLSGGWVERRTVIYTAAGVGITGFVVGGITGAVAISKRVTMASSSDERIASNCSGKVCNQEGGEAVASLKTLGLVSTIGFGVGIAAGAAAAVLYLTEPERAAAKPGAGAGLRVRAGLIPAGEGGAALGLQGVW